MAEQTEPGGAVAREVALVRYPLAVVACALTMAVWAPLAVGLGWAIFHFLGDWIDRQVWLVRVVLQTVFGLVIVCAFGGGWAVTTDVWYRITQPRAALAASGQKYGKHARWYPGRPADSPPGTDASEGAHGRCPSCEFSYGWDGDTCSHCGHARRASS
jgi:hypothetical protein